MTSHQTCVLKPKRSAIHQRSTGERTPSPPISIQTSPTSIAATAELTSGSQRPAVVAPTAATSGMNAIAGNGPNGTYERPSATITSHGPGDVANHVRPWRNASAR